MKRILFMLSAVLVVACQHQNPRISKEYTLPIINFRADIFKQHPNWLNNSAMAEETDKSIIPIVDSFLNTTDALKDIPFRLTKVEDLKNGSYAALFESSYQKDSLFNLEIIGIIDKPIVENLITDQKYFLLGKYKKRIVEPGDYFNSYFVNTQISRSKDIDDVLYLGLNLFEIDSVALVND